MISQFCLSRGLARRWLTVAIASVWLGLLLGLARAQEESPAPESQPPAIPSGQDDVSQENEPPPESEPATDLQDVRPAPKPAEASESSPSEPSDDAAASASGAPSEPIDPAELEAFIDGIMTAHMKQKHIAGATVAVVVDNRPMLIKGYGYANVAKQRPVDPAKTMFRIASVSKLFTWTAVMQLVEQGKLDLNADVNTYLEEFQVPATYAQPITLEHLLTHTPGFEDLVLGLFARSADEIEPLGTTLAERLPARVRPPGQLASYSNHGTALAGHIVARVSGVPWEEYIEANILEPLGMTSTLVRQPVEDEMPEEMSDGYEFERGRYVKQGFEYAPDAPAGCMSSSAGDMARFMIAHLQDGRYDTARILNEETARQMRSLLFTHDESLDGMAYGFARRTYNDLLIVHHGGDSLLFHTLLAMLPERGAGLFVSYNTATATGIRQDLLEAFVDRYYPVAATPNDQPNQQPDEAATSTELERLVGSYGGLRYSHTTMTKLGGLLNTVAVAEDDGELVLDGLGSTPKRFVEIEPLLFREADEQQTIAFRQNEHGQITHLFVSTNPYMAYRRLPWNETPRFMLLLVGGCGLVFLSAVVGWPWAAFVAWGAPRHTTGVSRIATAVGWLASATALGWMIAAAVVMEDANELAYGITPLVEALLWAASAIAVLVALVFLGSLLAWARGYWRFSGRLHYTCVLLAGLAFVWFLYYGNLMQWSA